MKRAIDHFTTCAACALILCASAGCKKKSDAPAPDASVAVSSASAPTIIAPLIPSAAAGTVDAGAVVAAPVLGDVKRFPDKEKAATGAVKVTLDESKVYDEPDNTKPSVASLSKDLFVVRMATLGTDWLLIDFPSGVGKLSPGWIEAKSVGAEVQTVTKASVAAQPSAKAATTAATTATAAPTATVAPAATATATATVAATASAPVAPRKPGAILARPH